MLDRYYKCAKKYKADIILRITADCPFVNKHSIKNAFSYFNSPPTSKYTCYAPISGYDVEIFTYHMLQEAYEHNFEVEDIEHVTPYMKRATKLSVDTPEDLKKVRKYYADLHNTRKN